MFQPEAQPLGTPFDIHPLAQQRADGEAAHHDQDMLHLNCHGSTDGQCEEPDSLKVDGGDPYRHPLLEQQPDNAAANYGCCIYKGSYHLIYYL